MTNLSLKLLKESTGQLKSELEAVIKIRDYRMQQEMTEDNKFSIDLLNTAIDDLKKQIAYKETLPTMTIEQARLHLNDVNRVLYRTREDKKDKSNDRKTIELQPLKLKAQEMEMKIDREVNAEFFERLREAEENVETAKKEIDKIMLIENSNQWLPEGTIVEQWETGRWNNIRQVTKTGIVALYNHQELRLPRYRDISVGDIIVIHLKKDGTQGKTFDRIQKHFAGSDYYTKGWEAKK